MPEDDAIDSEVQTNCKTAYRINLHASNNDSASSAHVVANLRLNYWSPKNTGSMLWKTSNASMYLPLGLNVEAEQKQM
jgi:hypothetical protein